MSGINEQVINAEIYQIGPQGIPGEAATISVGTVTTGEPGTDASVTNSGTSTAAILDFVIPQGEQGLQGIQGPQGIQGLTGATGNGILSIEKIATVGLTDTYRITFTNNTYYDFEVINGSSISDIEKTSTSGLVDTYTITLTNGNTHTFTVTNGAKGDKGETGEVGNGILGVNKMSTTGLVDNYRMTFTNGTYFDFDVTNAKSIDSISKISTSGLIDTYRIIFNDNTNFQFPVTNGRGITGVTLLSWEGLEKTYRMSFNDGSHFDFVVTNGAGSQVDWGGIYGVLSQQTDLQDALVQSNGLTMGSVSTYNVMLKELIERAHSTFDLSKFTVVGSPNITDDGIASGFSSDNYVKANGITLGSLQNKSFEIKIKFKVGEKSQPIWYPNIDWGGYRFSVGYQVETSYKEFRFHYQFGSSDSTAIDSYQLLRDGVNGSNINVGDIYELKYKFDYPNNLTFSICKEGTNNIISAKASPAEGFTNVGLYAINHYPNELLLLYKTVNNTEPQDLKQFSITVDGVEVFSGNKTGIDTIKPDDYNVVGTPTISADGVASGFSSSNYLQKLSILPTEAGHNYIFKMRYKHITNDFSATGYMFNVATTTGDYFGVVSRLNTKTISFVNSITGNSIFSNTVDLVEGKTYDIEYHTDFSTYAKYYIDGDLKESLTYSATGYPITGNVLVGVSINATLPLTMGSIDLNAFKIYVDGNLVYQPCLKIPYTQSKTGSKIVNAVYRGRVNDMASQFGSANYYTLSDTDFTLPQVELYGLIGDKTLRDSYYNGATYWELFSNRRLEQGGSCESGVEYTLPKPFANANYVLTIPYSSKTATSFIPSATGDFIAKGTGLL